MPIAQFTLESKCFRFNFQDHMVVKDRIMGATHLSLKRLILSLLEISRHDIVNESFRLVNLETETVRKPRNNRLVSASILFRHVS